MQTQLKSASLGTKLRCIQCEHTTPLYPERTFRCPKCLGLYEVTHEFGDRLESQRNALKAEFRARANPHAGHRNSAQTRSGVWRYHELIMPCLTPDQLITLGEGIVPIVPVGRHLRAWLGGDVDTWIILEGSGPTGSFKDYGGAAMISVAKAAGINAIGCASTGDTSAMTAAYAAAAEMTCFVIVPKGKITPVQLMQPAAHGARVFEVPGDFDDCMRMMQELVTKWGVYPANSLNPARIEGHQATVFQVAQFFGWRMPDWFAVPVGNGSNSSSIGKGLRLLRDHGFVKSSSRILGCQTEAANPLARAWEDLENTSEAGDLTVWEQVYRPMKAGPTIATATQIGDPVSRQKVMREITLSQGAMRTVTEGDIVEAIQACARDGHLLCPQTGIALAGLRRAIATNLVEKYARVLVVSTATGMKFAPVYEAHSSKAIETVPSTNAESVARMLNLS